MPKRNRSLLIVIIGLTIMLPISLYLVRRRLDLRPRAEFGNVTLALSPDKLTLAPAATATLALSLNSGAIKLSGIDVAIAFDPKIVKLTAIQLNSYAGFTDTLVKQIDSESGKARLALVARRPTVELPTGKITLASLTIAAQNTGSAVITLQPQEIVGFNGIEEDVRLAVGGVTNAEIRVGGSGAVPTATPTPPVAETTPGATPEQPTVSPPTTPPAAETPRLSFSTAFVGMSQNRPDLTVRLTVVDELAAQPIPHVFRPILSSDANRIYRPQQTLSLTGVAPGPGKTILLKGPKHLQKKVADRIELVAGDNGELDWSAAALQLEPGDLPNPADNFEQDGVVNAVDVALLIERIGSSDSADLTVADLNYDGIVNANDLSLLIETLSTRYDDEF